MPARAQARPRPPRRGDGPLRAARRMGQRHVPPAARRRVRRRRGVPDRPRPRGRRTRSQRERAIELARELLQCSPTALRHTIANARIALDEDEPAAIAAIAEMERVVRETEDFQEGIASFIERRPPSSPADERHLHPAGVGRSARGDRPLARLHARRRSRPLDELLHDDVVLYSPVVFTHRVARRSSPRISPPRRRRSPRSVSMRRRVRRSATSSTSRPATPRCWSSRPRWAASTSTASTSSASTTAA